MEKARILIVEDEAIIAMEVESQLQGLGYEVTSIVDTGERAIQKAEVDQPDLILMDIRIKGELDGIDTAEVIRTRFNIPVIFSTAYLDQERIERAKITMPFGYLLKPLQERDLKVTLEMALFMAKTDAERKNMENRLRESENRYESLFRNMKSGVAIYKVIGEAEDFVFVDFNDAAEMIDKQKKEKLIGQSIFKVRPSVNEFGLIDTFKEVWKTGKPKLHPITFYKDEKLQHWYENFVYKLPSDELVAVFTDETERIKTEEILKESEEKYRTIFESSVEGILIVDINTKKFKYGNPAICNMLGYSEKEFASLSVMDIHPKENLEYILSEFTAQAEGIKSLAQDIPCLRKDGEIIYADFNTVQIQIEGTKCNVGFIKDITERKQTDEVLRESEEKHRTLFETMTQGVVYQNAEGLITDANPAAERILGLSLSQLQGKTSMDPRWKAIHEDGSDFPGETHPIPVALKTGKTVKNVIQGVFHPVNEEYRWISVNAVPKFRKGESTPYEAYAIFDDITDERKGKK